MNIRSSSVVVSLFLLALAHSAIAEELVIRKDRKKICEYCFLSTWTASFEVRLKAKPRGANNGLIIRPGERVQAIDGEVHIRPIPVKVVRKKSLEGYPRADLAKYDAGGAVTIVFNPGEVIEVLDELNDGRLIRKNGRLFGVQLSNSDYSEKCVPGMGECWLTPLEAVPEDNQTWWVKIKSKSGKEGWTDQYRSFVGWSKD